eukprot:CAMPEP_0197900206 /NCGR_PEP_ID=MMETSP1439-20131203/48535_1 /TAXON_ID=66791 /ORGANISM="Gonyaulax spinifera, Strain CCMP409" /LENGTH=103 /DNA_ID=CAMNT_0043521073 /DNA_START=383 /DNA_END=695 /DNA_ORIENTATION=-
MTCPPSSSLAVGRAVLDRAVLEERVVAVVSVNADDLLQQRFDRGVAFVKRVCVDLRLADPDELLALALQELRAVSCFGICISHAFQDVPPPMGGGVNCLRHES